MRARAIVTGLVSIAVLALLALVFIPRLLKPEQNSNQTYWPTQGWHTSTPEGQGFDSAKLAEGLRALQEQRAGIDSLLIIRNGYVLLDAYFYPYDDSIPHNLASVTKSFMTTLIGIAAGQGKIQLDQPMVSYFPDRTIANLDERKEYITVRHLAGMVSGYQSGCMTGDEPTLDAMRSNPDWVQAALDRMMAGEPGVRLCYDSPGMHLLSAILQEATRMTALDFARQNLFEPLGIRDVYWESDPQGYTHGWGDLHLKPHDAAKLGYLWLNKGVWEGVQIVPADWVEDAVTAQSQGGGDDYGYGWWVSDDTYFALGRGGQYIKIYPALNAIVVLTGAGIDYDQIAPLLDTAFSDPNNSLPANPEGVAQLDAALRALAQAPTPHPPGALPDTARAISGKTYLFGPNAADVETLRIEFKDPTKATLSMRRQGSDEIWPIGLDGEYRLSSDGRGIRGYWEDPKTFVIEVFEIGLSTRRLHFEDDRLEISSLAEGLRFEGQIENP